MITKGYDDACVHGGTPSNLPCHRQEMLVLKFEGLNPEYKKINAKVKDMKVKDEKVREPDK
jgi:hypothetical protein